jgi:tRNA 2-selenouridine synthase
MLFVQVTDEVDVTALARYDAIFDVRSPGEFADDHLPGAINLPVLDDAERAEVGTLYVQVDPFLARRIGAAKVARNIARHLETTLADRPAAFRPLVYCWRGGQRSQAMATVLTQVGWRVTRLDGGYRTYRRRVQARLYDRAPDLKLVLLDGYTGSAKTEILGRLAAQGVQTLDLEGLAAHRGSLFGAVAGTPQPPQKLFETNLLAALDALDPTRPIVVEAESSRIGDIATPPLIWKAMQGAPRITLQVERSHRAAYTLSAYPDIRADPAALEAVLSRLPPRLGRARLEAWRALAAAGDFAGLADGLMEHHYDPAYAVSSRRSEQPILAQIALDDLGEAEQDRAAREIAAVVAGLAARGG